MFRGGVVGTFQSTSTRVKYEGSNPVFRLLALTRRTASIFEGSVASHPPLQVAHSVRGMAIEGRVAHTCGIATTSVSNALYAEACSHEDSQHL